MKPSVLGFRVILFLPLCACEVAAEPMPPITPAVVDSFWLTQAMVEANQPPPPPHARSISLGYVGDTPLSGGMMRDTPLPQPPMRCPLPWWGPPPQ